MEGRAAQADFCFVHFTDTHIIAGGTLHNFDTSASLQRVVAVLNALEPRPAFAVIGGDLVSPDILDRNRVLTSAEYEPSYRLFQERGYRIRLLSAAFRNHMHWSELIGGDVVISPPHAWQKRFNKSGISVESRIDRPIAPGVLKALEAFDDYRRASEENGLTLEEFDGFPPTRRTLRQFIAACHELDGIVRDVMVPNPDL